VLFRNAGWTKEEVITRFRGVAAIFSQCGIQITLATVVEADAPKNWIDVSWRGERRDLQIAKLAPETSKPILFFVRSDRDGNIAYAWRRGNNPDPHLSDTAWITAQVTRQSYRSRRDPSYLTEAHELGHILGDCSHVDDGSRNFLAGRYNLLNDQIRQDQCDAMKRHPLVRPL
jgi:hypothetical protein